MIGTRLHHYCVVRKLGSGGMGEVYAAEDEKLQRQVALKLLPPEMASDPERLQRFQREARAVAALNHPNVVTIYSVEEDAGVHFLTMELVEGQTLSEVIPEGGLPLERILTLAGPLIEAVAFAHDHGIVHRDLKPANIMLTGDGRLKVLDFGLAKLKPNLAASDATELPTQTLTRHHVVVGTAAYMSPEQAEGRTVDHRSDIFSLGVVLYEMACGRRPFTGDSDLSLISSIIKDTPTPLSDMRRDLPLALSHIVMRALAKDPAHRYQRAFDLGHDLRQVRAGTAAGRFVARIARAVSHSRWPGRAALAAVLVAGAAGAAWYLSGGRSTDGGGAQPASLHSTFRRLSAQPGVEQFPSLLPDGKWVLYSGQESGNRDIYLLSTSGQNPINLTADSPADDDEPAASPDGERIAFRSSREGGGIFVMGRTGEGVRRVTPTDVRDAYNPAWSPDGTEIAYTTENVQLTPMNGEGVSVLWIVNVNTGRQRTLDVGDAMQASWSPHGQRIAYVSRQQIFGGSGTAGGTGWMKICTVPAGGGPAVLATTGKDTDWSPVWAPDGKHLFFVSNRGGSMNLWRVAIDEQSGTPLTTPEPITTPAPFLAHPSISADGRRIAYTAVSETQNIQRLSLDPATLTVKGEPNWVTSGSRMWANPDPMPDGEWVVFYSRDQPEGDVYVCRPDGTGLRQLTSDVAIDRVPRWSPDGKWVAFFSERGGQLQIWKIRGADGSDLQQMTDAGTIPAWSPDSRRLATARAFSSTGTDRVVMVVDANRPVNEQSPETLPTPGAAFRQFIPISWSPDGARLAGQLGFSDRGGAGIVLYSFAARTYERMTDFGEWPAWFGDSRRILFVFKGREFWVVDTRTKQTRKIYSNIWHTFGPPRMTRDGRAVFYSRRMTEADIHLLTFE